MHTYREIVFMVQDQLKLISDDSYYTWDHIKFLINKFRAYILKKTYSDVKKTIPESNYQLVCLAMELVQDNVCPGGMELRSVEKLPDFIEVANPSVFSSILENNMISFVSFRRYQNTGFNRYLKNFIYATVAPDSKLRMKSVNPQFQYLTNIKMYGIFDDPERASELECTEEGESIECDVLDRDFPLEDALVPTLIEMTVKELSGSVYQPKDSTNNASDDLSDIASFVRRNMKERSVNNPGNDSAVQ